MSATPQARPISRPRIVVTTGTDHHPFDRLIEWTNCWLAGHPEQASAFFVQSGAAVTAPACLGTNFLAAGELTDLLDSAEVVVCHGGPGSIADAWARGRRPIVVPRLRAHGEVVDDHQVDFCRKLAELGRVRLAEDQATLAALLDEAAVGGVGFTDSVGAADTAAAVAWLAELVDGLVSRPRRRPRFPLTGRRTRRRPPAGPGSVAVSGGNPPELAQRRP